MNDLFQNDSWLLSPWSWAGMTAALSLWLLVPRGRQQRWQLALGGVAGVVSVGLLASRLPLVEPLGEAALFWLLAAVSVICAAAMISMHSPVYSAIWFALTLLATSCLFLLQGAQLLAVATVVVYAGAIVVMFLFLIMLAQPEGHEYYDRISWASPAALSSSVAGSAIVLILTAAVVGLGDYREQLREEIARLLPNVTNEKGERIWSAADIQSVQLNRSEANDPLLTLKLKRSASDQEIESLRDQLATLEHFEGKTPAVYQIQILIASDAGAKAEQHVATLGGVLFSRYLLAVEVAGTLLLVALVGAVAIVMFGREQERDQNGRRPTSPSAGGDA